VVDVALLDVEVMQTSAKMRQAGRDPAFVHLTADEFKAVSQAWQFSLVQHASAYLRPTYCGLRYIVHTDTPVIARVTD
jgi:hypothetical protein